MKRVYIVQLAYNSKDRNGISYNTIEAKSKKQALKQSLENGLKGKECAFITIKRCPRVFAEIIAEHNQKVKGEENE